MGDRTDGPTAFRASILWGLVAVAVFIGLVTAVQAYLMGPGEILATFWPRLAVVALLLLLACAVAFGLEADG